MKPPVFSTSFPSTIAAAAIAAALSLSPCSSEAAVVFAPTGVSASSSNPGTPAGRLIDQSGLSVGYQSGVTDAADYLAALPVHAAVGANSWGSAGDLTPSLLFDLGTPRALDALLFWNSDVFSVGLLDLITSPDGAIWDLQLANAAVAMHGPGVDAPVQTFAFGPGVLARYVLLQLTCGPNEIACGMAEAALVGPATAVPTPTTAALLPAALLALLGLRTRRNTRTPTPWRAA